MCRFCFNFTDGFQRCYACTRCEQWLAAMAPISYCVAGSQLHHVLAYYKRFRGGVADRLASQLAAVLRRYVAEHELCLARRAGVASFPLVATVPSGERTRDEHHPLRRIVESMGAVTRGRHERLLTRTAVPGRPHLFDPERYAAAREIYEEPVLLIDDTWTTGASAQSAAAALKRAGAGPVAALVIGRYVSGDWHHNASQIRAIRRSFDWSSCAWHEGSPS